MVCLQSYGNYTDRCDFDTDDSFACYRLSNFATSLGEIGEASFFYWYKHLWLENRVVKCWAHRGDIVNRLAMVSVQIDL